ncbi:MAG: hypothetical protein HYX93_01790 [Chloroflexi bacterium]|nr:hypothetical protein [Chloroflexota bacterium]
MGIRDHLREGEAIISDHSPYYATSYRVIYYQERDGTEELHDPPYGLLSSVEVIKLPRHRVMIASTLMIIGGAVMASYGFFTSWLAIVVGVGGLIYGGMGRKAYYQFRVRGMTQDGESQWRLPYWGSGSFVRTVRTIIGDRSGP